MPDNEPCCQGAENGVGCDSWCPGPRATSERRVQPAGWGGRESVLRQMWADFDSGAWRPIEDDLALLAAQRKAASDG